MRKLSEKQVDTRLEVLMPRVRILKALIKYIACIILFK